MADAQPQQQQINLPSLALILVLSGLIVRYLFFSPPSSSSSGSSSSSSSTLRGGADPAAVMRAREAAVERIQQMFPQAERRAVLWDLQRGGGSVAGTAERILAGRLETVSLSFCSFFGGEGEPVVSFVVTVC
jgi:coupling of ubiquitin conjugation to ER degradation protein 1